MANVTWIYVCSIHHHVIVAHIPFHVPNGIVQTNCLENRNSKTFVNPVISERVGLGYFSINLDPWLVHIPFKHQTLIFANRRMSTFSLIVYNYFHFERMHSLFLKPDRYNYRWVSSNDFSLFKLSHISVYYL